MSHLRRLRLLFLLAVLLLGALTIPLPASAHARLQRSTPSAGAALLDPPTEINMSFSEPVAREFSKITLLDRERREQVLGTLKAGGEGDTAISVLVGAKLPPGIYAVIWRIVSAVDGHLTSGSFGFRVVAPGEPTEGVTTQTGAPSGSSVANAPADAPLEGSGDMPDAARWLLRAMLLAAITVALGGAIFTVLVSEPASSERGNAGESLWPVLGRRFALIGTVLSAFLMLGLALDLVLQVSVIAQTDFAGGLKRADLASLLVSTTRYGFSWLLKVLSTVLLFMLFLFIWKKSRRGGAGLWEPTIAAGSLFLLAESLSSHAAAQSDHSEGLPIPIISDWLHMVTSATWVGGLVYMAIVLFPSFRALGFAPEERRAFLGRSVPRFSKLALLSVLVLGVSGTYNLAIHSTDLGAIAGSFYGQVILAKVALFVLLIALGAVNLVHFSPQFITRRSVPSVPHSAPPSLLAAFRRNVRAEVAIMLAVLVCAGGLSLLPPPSNAASSYLSTYAAVATPGTASASAEPITGTSMTSVGGYNLAFTAKPSVTGDKLELVISRTLESAPPLTDVTSVLFVVTPQDIEAGGTVFTAALRGEAGPQEQTWSVAPSAFPVEGSYRITAVAQRNTSADLKSAYLMTWTGTGVHVTPLEYVDLRFNSQPDPPTTGTTHAQIELRNAEARPIVSASLSLSLSQPTHTGASPFQKVLPISGKPGFYMADLNFAEAGDWLIAFNVQRDGQPDWRTSASITVEPPRTPSGP